jgi:hypothetical protein
MLGLEVISALRFGFDQLVTFDVSRSDCLPDGSRADAIQKEAAPAIAA